ncbi:hypothetical protein HVV52_08200 [Escherichia fergusonii]|uniref:hypothetical protein n=1 Tax=Escherichia fergusonii TaxID=564 RepID=UPI0015E55370|nr:hypothetical protein [Escherichia fergusonii]QLM06197.1 hypothetical protein HVV50_08190 [Escherichia fergusonii]QLM10792.1 hypothetical protein HVV51_08200 [Escherichia fergusonii]QLM15387.1 hypothetical protein HVV52_08200 [Escherichia fergusonii]QMQ68696.1 hypothetical protein HVV54_08195 [Escherichia fergusonii]WFV01733.1 hypothetical protein NFJ18_08240 [Escherichia fergusonii]
MQLHQKRPMKRAGEAGKALRAGGGADFIFSASERVVTALSLPVVVLVCLRGVLCGGERVRA